MCCMNTSEESYPVHRLVSSLCILIVAGMVGFLLSSVQSNAAAASQPLSLRPGFPALQPYGSFFSSPTVIDLTGDGVLDIVSADSTGCVWGFTPTGGLLPGFPWKTGGMCDNAPRINGSLAIADIDRDGKLDVVAGTRGTGSSAGQRGKVFAWRRDGTVLPGWPKEMDWAGITNGNIPEVMSVTMVDIAGNSNLEILAATTNEAGSNTNDAPNLYAWNVDGSPVPGFPLSSTKGSGFFGQLAAADLTGDGKAEIIIGRDEMYMNAYTGTGQQVAGWPVRTYLDGAAQTWGRDKYIEFTRSAPTVADLDSDGTPEIIVAGKVRDPLQAHQNTSTALIILAPNGQRRPGWSIGRTVGSPLRSNYFTPNNPVVVVDLDHDGVLEIVVTFDDGTIRAYRENGVQLWSYNYASGRALYASEVAVGDITGDGVPEIVFGTYSYDGSANNAVGMSALNARSGQLLSGFPLALPNEGNSTTAIQGVIAGPTLADLDGNCSVELVAHSKGGALYAWNTLGRVQPGSMPWMTARLDPQRHANRVPVVSSASQTCGVQPSATMTYVPPTAAPSATRVPSTVPPSSTIPPVQVTPTPLSSAGPSITKLTLINADTDLPIAGFESLGSSTTLNFGSLPTHRLNMRAFTNPGTVGSVKFVLNGGITRIENGAPYALAGNNGNDYSAWTPTIGPHTLTIIAYTGMHASGTAGIPLTITFMVSSPPPVPPASVLPSSEGIVFLPLLVGRATTLQAL